MLLIVVLLRISGLLGALYLAWRVVLGALRVRWARYAYPVSPLERGGSPAAKLDRCRGSLIGVGLGDALNLPAESVPRWLTRLRYPGPIRMRRGLVRFLRRAGDVSDDTQLTIAVARSVDPGGRYRHQRFLDELGLWSYTRIGAGRASRDAAVRIRRGRKAESTTLRRRWNQSSARVAIPIAWGQW
ncbi:MAG: ADP-ribosylglycohydrolase family protein [Myxococcales bacterium]|nr:ADP-ribosylglycohydrolase family protein [Myxococcales bacterium]